MSRFILLSLLFGLRPLMCQALDSTQTVDIPMAGIRNISIDTIAYDVTVNKGTGPTFNIQLTATQGKTFELSQLISQDGTHLRLQTEPDRRGWFLDRSHDAGSVQISLPRDFDGDISLKTVSGDIHLTETSSDLNVSTVSGDVMMKDFKSAKVNLDTVSGDVSLQPQTDIRKVRMESTSGDLKYHSASQHQLALKVETRGRIQCDGCQIRHSMSGHHTVKRLGDMPSSGQIDFSSVSGDFKVE